MCDDRKWDYRFVNLAREISTWSKDPSTQIGAIAVDSKRRIIATGYNGFPSGMCDDESLYNNREEKLKRIIHAEMNVIYNAAEHGVSLSGATLYVWGLPVCSHCALGVIQSGISRVVMVNTKPHDERWNESWKLTEEMFKNNNPSIEWLLLEEYV